MRRLSGHAAYKTQAAGAQQPWSAPRVPWLGSVTDLNTIRTRNHAGRRTLARQSNTDTHDNGDTQSYPDELAESLVSNDIERRRRDPPPRLAKEPRRSSPAITDMVERIGSEETPSPKKKLRSVVSRLAAVQAFKRMVRGTPADDSEVEQGYKEAIEMKKRESLRERRVTIEEEPARTLTSPTEELVPHTDKGSERLLSLRTAGLPSESNVSPTSDSDEDGRFQEDEDDEAEEEPPSVSESIVMLPDSPFRVTWDLLYMLFVGYEFFLWLLCISTLGHGKDGVIIQVDGIFHAIRIILSLFWCCDLFVQMTTATLRGWDIEENPVVLSKRFRKERLPVDAIITLPIDVIFAFALPPRWTYYAMTLRCVRLIRIPFLFPRSTPTREMPRWVECVQFTFWFYVLSHVSACVWIATATVEEQNLGLTLDEKPYDVYTQSLYFIMTTMTSVGYGDISPSFNGTRWYAMFLQLVGVALMMLVSGRTGAYFITTDPFRLMQIERRRRLESLMSHQNIPWKIQKEAFTIYPSLLDAGMRDYQSILTELPDFIREKISRHMKVSLIGNVPMFKGVSRRVLTHVAEVLREDYRGSKEYLIQAGERGHEMYILSQGMVEVLIPDRNRPEYEVWATNLKAGSWFGEIALLKQTTRTASIRSVTACVLFRLEKDDFQAVLARSSELRERLTEETEKRLKDTRVKEQESKDEKEKQEQGSGVGGVVGSHNIDKKEGKKTLKKMLQMHMASGSNTANSPRLRRRMSKGRLSRRTDDGELHEAANGEDPDKMFTRVTTPVDDGAGEKPRCPLDPPAPGPGGVEVLSPT
eukprot:Hpha_TRINITY_DN3272_c0_g2::TRINITY_DN3272_c0_g2_i1::g.185990::m.185990/K04956/HCN3; hyperpolarization activated cyclic nucleotide-gated potassium channel 3